MAKITANGEREAARFRHPVSGAELLLTAKKSGKAGRVLSKQQGGSWALRSRPKGSLEEAREELCRLALSLGFEQARP